jgi:hypothetical protein
MISLETIELGALALWAVLFIILIVVNVCRLRNRKFIGVQILVIMIILLILAYTSMYGTTESYTSGREYTNLKHLSVYDDKSSVTGKRYEITLDNGQRYITYDAIAGDEYKVVRNAKIIRKTELGIRVYVYGTILVYEVDTSNMSESEKKHYTSK